MEPTVVNTLKQLLAQELPFDECISDEHYPSPPEPVEDETIVLSAVAEATD